MRDYLEGFPNYTKMEQQKIYSADLGSSQIIRHCKSLSRVLLLLEELRAARNSPQNKHDVRV